MTIKQAYEEYMIPSNLQRHMLTVGALAEFVHKYWKDGRLNKNTLVKSALLHDIAKPINFDLSKQASYGMTEKDISKLDRLQKKLKLLGGNEHEIAIKICENIGCSKEVIETVGNTDWSYIPRLIKENNMGSLFVIYCDMRVGPNGVLSMEQRLEELKQRTGESWHVENGIKVETIIKMNVSIDLRDVNNESINPDNEELLGLNI
jgi:hypothetical protein